MTLSQAATLTKQIITLSIIILTFGLISFIAYKVWYAYYLANLPLIEEKPNLKFGVLPAIDFPKSLVSSSNFSYSIDTSTGNLPKVGVDPGFEKIIKVYFVTKTLASLLSSEKSQVLAAKFDIKSEPQILSETSYRFADNGKTLTVDLDSGNFIFKNDSKTPTNITLDDDNKLTSDFIRSLESLVVLKEDLRKGPSKILLLKNDSNKLTPTNLRSETIAAQISLWPASIDKKVIVTSQFSTSTISGIVYQSAADLNNFLALNFVYYPVDTSTFATYPIRSTEEALADLKSGKGIVIIEPEKPQVSITSIYLGYFLPDNYNPYLQPVFVFEGPHFVAYVPAISSDSVNTSE
ncbi:hypothetical protein HYW41_03790 [Candidatus Daviesbacteria bacterium]|nr:hypothetical protein [Candidatus Daviesbacteria bacterium]